MDERREVDRGHSLLNAWSILQEFIAGALRRLRTVVITCTDTGHSGILNDRIAQSRLYVSSL